MASSLRFCLGGGCTGIAASGKYCAACLAAGAGKRVANSPFEKWYDTAAWRGSYGARGFKLRHFPMCEIEGCTKPATDVHHKDGSWKQTGDWRLFISQDNLLSLCHEDHSKITMEENHKHV